MKRFEMHIYKIYLYVMHTGIQQAPAVARAVMEMILDGEFRTLDLTKYHFERFLIGKKIKENIVN